MASIVNSGPTASARWTLTALLRRLQPAARTARVSPAAAEVALQDGEIANRRRRAKRSRSRRRESLFEQSAMAREMFRL
jgi:hypothetical protein